jgi:hypothetical protein
MRLLSASLVAHCALLVAGTSASVGCSAPEADVLGVRANSIVNGDVSPDEQNAVVAIQYPGGITFTGTLVAPTLVLTARHGVIGYADAMTGTGFDCLDAIQGAPVDHNVPVEELSIHVGSRTPIERLAGVVRIFSGRSLDLCESDVALLELDTPLDVPPLPLRLQADTAPGEAGTLIGWGRTERDLGTGRFITAHGSRRQVQLAIEAVGPDDVPLADGPVLRVLDSRFVTGPGACYGDSGAPFISQESGAVMGVFSTLDLTGTDTNPPSLESCLVGHPVYRRLAAAQYSWLKDAFRTAGQAPWYEGHARPAVTGSACQSNEECQSQLCLHAKSGNFCSQKCAADECPAGMACLVVSDEPAADAAPVCVLDQLAVPGSERHGCSASPLPANRTGTGSALLLLVLTIWKRSRMTNRSVLLARRRTT